MKKFLAIVMCLAMALSMMTVVSFAADITVGGNTVTAAPGEAVDIPVYVNADIFASFMQLTIDIPDGIECSVEAGIVPSASLNIADGQILVMEDAGKTYSPSTAAFTIKLTAPATAGKYTFEFVGDNMLFDESYELMDVALNSVVLDVKAAEVNPEATIIATPTEAPNGGVVKVLQFANATEFGIKYTGSDADWAGQEFRSLATTGTIAAVEVVGLDDSFVAYAK